MFLNVRSLEFEIAVLQAFLLGDCNVCLTEKRVFFFNFLLEVPH